MNEEKPAKVKEYTNGEVTVVWQPEKCIHSTNCFRGLPEVFDPRARPWVRTDGATSEQIIAQVRKCPSGALSFFMNDHKDAPAPAEEVTQIVEVLKNGPLMVHGHLQVKHPDGSVTSKEHKTAFCRCGASASKPFCDGSHRRIGFEG